MFNLQHNVRLYIFMSTLTALLKEASAASAYLLASITKQSQQGKISTTQYTSMLGPGIVLYLMSLPTRRSPQKTDRKVPTCKW